MYTTKAQQSFKVGYEYTKTGNIAQTDVNGQVSSFVYDANDQLEEETLPDGTMNTYEYDEVGNRTASEVNGEKATFTYNDANQIATKNEPAYTYDKDGNLLQDEHYEHYKRKVSQKRNVLLQGSPNLHPASSSNNA
ncbi:RHS repeat domain-containing protein [Kurthia sibirica]|uniref:Teneurin-like YD-shell domain-containing protein n=2 Tax=Kurthia sibirica TaxID=202750 RepID=A0A2U3AJ23_9BACL|nr:RHS repeat domain-containing protein [Kurthia sibirica]PWI24461.1 hypothetical protein DEX24_13435 [Kurthia sibirica]